MTKVNTSELTGAALDWAVAKCEGYAPVFTRHYVTPSHAEDPKKVCIPAQSWVQPFEPSINWGQAGPILEREIAKVFRNVGGTWSAMILKDVPIPPEDRGTSLALTRRAQWNGAGPTPLIAAMRCYCCSKLGDVVDIPEELCQQQNS